MPGDGGVAELAGHGRRRVVAGPLAEVRYADALDMARSRPIFGIWMIPTGSPIGGGTSGRVVVVVVGGRGPCRAAAFSLASCWWNWDWSRFCWRDS